MPKQWAMELVNHGRLRVNLATNFADSFADDIHRHDPLEGRFSALGFYSELTEGNIPKYVPARIENSPGCAFRNCMFETHFTLPMTYIYCLSTVFDIGLLDAFESDCILVVEDIDRLLRALNSSMFGVGDPCAYGPCHYREGKIIGYEYVDQYAHLLKPDNNEYQSQHEYRFAYSAVSETAPQFVDLQSRLLKKSFKIIHER